MPRSASARDAADQRERHVAEHDPGVLGRVVEEDEQHHEDQQDGDRHHDAQAALRAREIFELSAPPYRIAGRNFHGGHNLRLRLSNKASLIAITHVGPHAHLTTAGVARNDRLAFHHADVRHIRQRYARAAGSDQLQILNRRNAGTRFLGVAQCDRESTLAFVHGADRLCRRQPDRSAHSRP